MLIASCACFCASVFFYLAFTGACANASTFVLRGAGIAQSEAQAICEQAASTCDSYSLVFWPQMDGSASRNEADTGNPVYTRLTTAKLDKDGFPITADTLLSTLSIECDQLEYGLLSLASFLALLAYPLAFGVFASIRCRRFRTRETMPVPLTLFGFTVPALVAVAATATFASSLPEFGRYLPSVWSDFSAWASAAEAASDSVALIASTAKGATDLRLLFPWICSVALAAGSTVLAAGAMRGCARWDSGGAAHARKDG
ncbi:hypothetical protein [Raoultibacter phocaeensis]|uniref:hypothetical protein n=1 Tax=Raoultibacter phocaeensis TaxID=2479841 RepID=UPI00111840CD|nr:hypothetical protein [Raoultibacter phocaeensis]